MFCGSPRQVADQMEEWFTAPVCGGVVLLFDDFVRAHGLRRGMPFSAGSRSLVRRRTGRPFFSGPRTGKPPTLSDMTPGGLRF
jgi:hypothetical protein